MRIACVLKSGGEYHPWHVYALRDMCKQWLPEHDFVCLTDVPSLDCITIPLKHQLRGWWSKMELFDTFTEGETLYMDLDTVVRGPCAKTLQQLIGKQFVILHDFYRSQWDSKAMGSGLMFWRGDYRWIFELFMSARPESRLSGDQCFLEFAFINTGRFVEYWQDFTSAICSFKLHIRDQNPPSTSAIVCFHGQPRPWNQSMIGYPAQSMSDVIFEDRNGWLVPSHDTQGFDAILRDSQGIPRMLKYCRSKRTAFQAGGNIGIWPVALAKEFAHCISVEPENDNFHALKKNTSQIPNITIMQMAIGNLSGTTSMQKVKGNMGAHYCTPGEDVKICSIDSLGLKEVDYIQLDIEGFEHQAILGAKLTIEANLPVIVLELNGLGNRNGHSDQSTIDLMESLGYQIVDRIARDVVFVHHSQLRSLLFNRDKIAHATETFAL